MRIIDLILIISTIQLQNRSSHWSSTTAQQQEKLTVQTIEIITNKDENTLFVPYLPNNVKAKDMYKRFNKPVTVRKEQVGACMLGVIQKYVTLEGWIGHSR